MIQFQTHDGADWQTQFSIPARMMEKLIHDDPPIKGHIAVSLTDEP